MGNGTCITINLTKDEDKLLYFLGKRNVTFVDILTKIILELT